MQHRAAVSATAVKHKKCAEAAEGKENWPTAGFRWSDAAVQYELLEDEDASQRAWCRAANAFNNANMDDGRERCVGHLKRPEDIIICL